MNTNKFLELYRLQTDRTDLTPYFNRHMPVKRVIISALGKIDFNPDERQYIYFSATKNHHVYYIFNKVIKIIIEELKKVKHINIYSKLGIPENLNDVMFYQNININIIKKVKDFFRNFLPPTNVELVTLKYLNSFSDFLNNCFVSNKKKTYSYAPEKSDTSNFGGAYGINDAWLQLLKCCTYSSSNSILGLDKFFDFLLENSYRAKCGRLGLKTVLRQNPHLFEIMNLTTKNCLANPAFYEKNNFNSLVASVNEIYNKKLYNTENELSCSYFYKVKKNIKEEIEEFRK